LVYAYVNILGRSIPTIKKNPEAFVVASEVTEREVNAEKTKYMIMSRDKDAGQSHSIKIYSSSFERLEEFKYLGTTLTNQNSIQEEIKSRWKSENAFYLWVQNLLSSSLLPKNLKIRLFRTIILPVVLYGCETWLLTDKQERSSL